MDSVDAKTRSLIMARVGQRNTDVELSLRTELHKLGLRYKLHDRKLPGTPDLVFPRFSAVVFVNGCFWHFHGCHRSSVPKSRQEFWREKFQANLLRDEKNIHRLMESGWRVLTVWECALKGKTASPVRTIARRTKAWLLSKARTGIIQGGDSSQVR